MSRSKWKGPYIDLNVFKNKKIAIIKTFKILFCGKLYKSLLV